MRAEAYVCTYSWLRSRAIAVIAWSAIALPPDATRLAHAMRVPDVGQRERLPDGDRELTASHNWLRIAGSVIFSSRASSIALLTMTDSVRSPSNGR